MLAPTYGADLESLTELSLEAWNITKDSYETPDSKRERLIREKAIRSRE